jgi:hypothetical protein
MAGFEVTTEVMIGRLNGVRGDHDAAGISQPHASPNATFGQRGRGISVRCAFFGQVNSQWTSSVWSVAAIARYRRDQTAFCRGTNPKPGPSGQRCPREGSAGPQKRRALESHCALIRYPPCPVGRLCLEVAQNNSRWFRGRENSSGRRSRAGRAVSALQKPSEL